MFELRKAYGINVEKRQTGVDVFEYRWVDTDATKARVLALVLRGAVPTPVEPKQGVLI